jgi:hypothetical protein
MQLTDHPKIAPDSVVILRTNKHLSHVPLRDTVSGSLSRRCPDVTEKGYCLLILLVASCMRYACDWCAASRRSATEAQSSGTVRRASVTAYAHVSA